MVSKKDKNAQRLKRHARVRGKISGTTERPRLAVYRSNANIYAQIIDDVKGVTLCSASTVEKDFEGIGSNKEAAKKVGKKIAEKALAGGITEVVFDRGGISITDVYRSSLQVQEKADLSSKFPFASRLRRPVCTLFNQKLNIISVEKGGSSRVLTRG